MFDNSQRASSYLQQSPPLRRVFSGHRVEPAGIELQCSWLLFKTQYIATYREWRGYGDNRDLGVIGSKFYKRVR